MVALICKIAISSIEIIGTLIWLEISMKASIPLPVLKICSHHRIANDKGILAKCIAAWPNGYSAELVIGGPEFKSHPDR